MIATLAFVLAAQASLGGLPAAPPADCASLKSLQLPDVRITGATPTAAPASGAVRVAHCEVLGTVGREIRFRLLLPDGWNRKFMMGGGGGFVGGIDNQALSSINDGYATVGTDTGHQGMVTTASWALNDIERQLNFGHLGVHRVAETAKAIIRHYYRADIERSYFNGCSNGGRQALMEAQRYPDDFDGIIAGAPAADFTGIGAQFVRNQQLLFPDPRTIATPVFSDETLKSVEAQIVDQCDRLDGVGDGLMTDPRRCTVDVATLTGLTGAQKTTLAALYAETIVNGEVVYPAQPVGGEGQADGWPAWITGVNRMLMGMQKAPSAQFAFGTEMFKYFIYGDRNWDYSTYDFRSFRKDSALAASILNATNPDLTAFKASNGKLVIYHGWSDAGLSALGTLRYVDQVQARDAGAQDYVRTFMMPGVLHCAGGTGPDRVNWASVIENWVEKGQAPERVVATRSEAGKVVRTRPLCAYPLRAVYSGSGSIDDEKNFTCGK